MPPAQPQAQPNKRQTAAAAVQPAKGTLAQKGSPGTSGQVGGLVVLLSAVVFVFVFAVISGCVFAVLLYAFFSHSFH